jgi:hypothetical protein
VKRFGFLTVASLLLLLLAGAAPSLANTVTLFDNLNSPAGDTCGTDPDFGLLCAQRFQTGPAAGYTLQSVFLPIYNLSTPDSPWDGTVTLSLYTDDFVNMVPLAEVPGTLTLAAGATIPQGVLGNPTEFDASQIYLRGDTAYWVALSSTGNTEWSLTANNSPSAAVGFPAEDGVLWMPTFSGDQRMQVNADAVPEPASLWTLLGGLALVLVQLHVRRLAPRVHNKVQD